jgi:hypothetical protein
MVTVTSVAKIELKGAVVLISCGNFTPLFRKNKLGIRRIPVSHSKRNNGDDLTPD